VQMGCGIMFSLLPERRVGDLTSAELVSFLSMEPTVGLKYPVFSSFEIGRTNPRQHNPGNARPHFSKGFFVTTPHPTFTNSFCLHYDIENV
jgi:hypothetical protein